MSVPKHSTIKKSKAGIYLTKHLKNSTEHLFYNNIYDIISIEQ